MIGPFIIHQLEDKDFPPKALKNIRLQMGLRSKAQVLDEILLCWTALASTSAMVFAAEMESYDSLDVAITSLAKQLIKVWF
jgi:hypothetical protein